MVTICFGLIMLIDMSDESPWCRFLYKITSLYEIVTYCMFQVSRLMKPVLSTQILIKSGMG